MCQLSSSTLTTLECIAPPLSVLYSYTIIMDAAPGPDNLDSNLTLSLANADPEALQLGKRSRRIDFAVNDSIIRIDVSKV